MGFWSPSTLALLNLGVSTGASLLSTSRQVNAARRAGEIESQSNAETLAWLKEQDARDRAQYGEEYARRSRVEDEILRREQEDRTRRYGIEDVDRARLDAREARLAPFREGAAAGSRTLAALLRPSGPGPGTTTAMPMRPQASTYADYMRTRTPLGTGTPMVQGPPPPRRTYANWRRLPERI